MLEALGSDVSITGLARECGLSVSHFIRAFRQSTGTSPYQWLRRVDRAMSLLASSELAPAEVALTCGFCSQAHLNRVLLARVGTTLGRWQREHGGGSEAQSPAIPADDHPESTAGE
jgi:AraC family transcriptional regulator